MTLSSGEVFAGYTVERLLGAGAMGEVYLAQHPRLPRREALKILRSDISTDESFRQRFIREADSIAALEHPHIVTVHDRGDTDGRLWIATQFVDGADAAQLLRDRYPAGMPADEVAAITAAIADALDYAHGKGLLHRDVKPANILLAQPDHDGNRRIYLADFGIARPLDDPTGLTATNFTFGTFAYAAPEQLMGKELDGRADQYALAATAYHLLTGTPVYSGSNPVAVISHQLTEPPPAPSTVRASLAPFDAAFSRALAKNPEDRFSRCQDFSRAINAAASESGAGYSASAPTQEARVPAASAETGRRSPRLAIGGAAALLGLSAGGALLWHPWAKPDEAPIAPSTSSVSSTTSVTTPTTLTTTTTVPSSSPPPAPAPPPQTKATPVRPTYPPAGALGSACPPPGGAIGTGPDGAIYYCSRIQYTDGYVWSLTPGDIPNPLPPLDILPGSPCMVPGSPVDTTRGQMWCVLNNGRWSWELGAKYDQPIVKAPTPAGVIQPGAICHEFGAVAQDSGGRTMWCSPLGEHDTWQYSPP